MSQHHRVPAVLCLGLFLNQLKDSGRAGKSVLKLRNDAGDFIERFGVLVCIGEKTGKLSDGNPATQRRQRAGERHARINQTVYKPGTGIGEGGKENCPEGILFQPSINLVKLFQRFFFSVKSLHHLLIPYHFINQGGLLPSGFRLQFKHGEGLFGDKACHKQGYRCDNHHHQGNPHIHGKHKAKGSQNRHHAGKKLGKAYQKAVRKLVHIRHHTAHDVPVGMGIQIS